MTGLGSSFMTLSFPLVLFWLHPSLGLLCFCFHLPLVPSSFFPYSFAVQVCVLFLWIDELSSSVLISISFCLVRDGASHDLSYFKFH